MAIYLVISNYVMIQDGRHYANIITFKVKRPIQVVAKLFNVTVFGDKAFGGPILGVYSIYLNKIGGKNGITVLGDKVYSGGR